jgi:ABC-type polysaccharide/polyol phosphate export permease
MQSTAEGFVLDDQRTPLRTLLREIWASRELIRILARKDFYVRYRRASLGMLWAVGLPVIQATVMALVFTHRNVGGVTGNVPGFIFSGMVGWSFFSGVVGGSSTAIVDGAGLSNRIYFPRAVLPLTNVVSAWYGFVISAVVMLGAAVIMSGELGPRLLLAIPAAILTTALTAAFVLTLSAAHVYFRDLRYVVAAVMQPWMFLTPIFYQPNALPSALRPIVRLNPATGIVEFFHAATVGASPGWGLSLISSCVTLVVLLVVAVVLHTRYDRLFADLL